MAGKIHVRFESDLGSLVNNLMGSDVRFTFAEEEPVYGHKVILAARCGYFRRLFFESGAHMAEGQSSTVIVRDCPRDAFLMLITLLYTGEADVGETNMLIETQRLANMYDLQEFATTLEHTVVENVTEENIVSSMEAAHRAGSLGLRNTLVDKFCELGRECLLQGEAAKLLSKEVLSQIAQQALASAANAEPFDVLAGKVKHERKAELQSGPKRRKHDSCFIGSLFGDKDGWNVVSLNVHRARCFFVKMRVAKGFQVRLWVSTEADIDGKPWASELHLPFDVRNCVLGTVCKTGDKLELRVDMSSKEAPHAQFLINGQEIQQLALSSDALHGVVLILGDSDGVEDLFVGSGSSIHEAYSRIVPRM